MRKIIAITQVTLDGTRSTPKGVLISAYRSAGPVKTGSL
jgi:hypothetical protein